MPDYTHIPTDSDEWKDVDPMETHDEPKLPPDTRDDWDKATDDLKAGFSQVNDALKDLIRTGKKDPRWKKLGDDVTKTFSQLGRDISEFFDGGKK